jgi:hypothetical protein
MATHTHTPGSDKGAAYTGLVGAVIFLLITVVAIVKLTNDHYAKEGAHAPAAGAAAGAAQH